MKILEKEIPDYLRAKLASYSLGINFYPAISKDNFGYSIRVIIYSNFNGKTAWDYFKTDLTGLVIESPRGRAKDYNKKIRFTNLEELLEEFKEKKVNQF